MFFVLWLAEQQNVDRDLLLGYVWLVTVPIALTVLALMGVAVAWRWLDNRRQK
jgi:hypothetical protein